MCGLTNSTRKCISCTFTWEKNKKHDKPEKKVYIHPELYRLKNVPRHISMSTNVQKKLYSTTHRRFAKLQRPITLQFCKKSTGSTNRGLEPQTPCQAPGLDSYLTNEVIVQVDVRKHFVDLQCFGKGLWTKTMSNHVCAITSNAICGNIQPCPLPHNSNQQTAEAKILREMREYEKVKLLLVA